LVGKSKIYKPSPLNIHVRPNCVHEEIRVTNDGKAIYEKFLFTQTNFPCGGCNSPDDVIFMRCSPINDIVRSCTYCGVTQPISPRDVNGNVRAQQFEDETHEMNADEVKEFVTRNKIMDKFLHPILVEMLESKREKRKVNIDNLGLEEEELKGK